MNDRFEDNDDASVAERHSQIMAEGTQFFRRIAWGCAMIIVAIVGFIIFLFFKNSQFWRYP